MPKNPTQLEFILWLRALLMDEKHRELLRAWIQHYELPVIEIGERN
jgi:hypothetical protein